MVRGGEMPKKCHVLFEWPLTVWMKSIWQHGFLDALLVKKIDLMSDIIALFHFSTSPFVIQGIEMHFPAKKKVSQIHGYQKFLFLTFFHFYGKFVFPQFQIVYG